MAKKHSKCPAGKVRRKFVGTTRCVNKKKPGRKAKKA